MDNHLQPPTPEERSRVRATTSTNPYHGAELWRMPRVCAFIGLKKSMIYKMIRQGDFPASIPLVGRTKCWRSSDVIAWAEAKARAGSVTAAALKSMEA